MCISPIHFSARLNFNLPRLCHAILLGLLVMWLLASPNAGTSATNVEQTLAPVGATLNAQNYTWNRRTQISAESGQIAPFRSFRFSTTMAGNYTITMTTTGFAGAVNTYQFFFDPYNSAAQFWQNGVVADSTGTVSQPVFFTANSTFEVVLSAKNAGSAGTFSATISGPAAVNIQTPGFAIFSQPQSRTIVFGSSVTLQVYATGPVPQTFQWFRGQSGDTSNPISGATSTSLTTSPLTADTGFWVRVTSPDSSVDSATATVFVISGPITFSSSLFGCDEVFHRPTAPGTLSNQTFPYKLFRFRVSTTGNYTFSLQASGFQGTMVLYDQIFDPDNPLLNLAQLAPTSGDPVVLTQHLLQGGGVYFLVITSTNHNATGAFTLTVNNDPALVTRFPVPLIVTQPTGGDILRGQTLTLNVAATGSDLSYQWIDAETCEDIPGETTTTFTTPPLTRYQGYAVRVSNSHGFILSNVAQIRIIPVANPDAFMLGKNTALTVTTPGLLQNDVVADNRTLTASKVGNTTHGVLTLKANGSFDYTPNGNYVGPDSFTYRASDGALQSSAASVSLTVCPVINLSPASLPSATAGVAYSQTVTPSGSTAPYTFTVSGLPNGLSVAATNTDVTISGAPIQTGNFPVTVNVTDSLGCQVSKAYTLTVNCQTITLSLSVNGPPTIASAAALTRRQDSPASAAVQIATVNDAETAANSLTVAVISGGTATGITVGSITNTSGAIMATVAAGCGATSGTVRLQVTDGGSLTTTADLQVNVTANTQPTLTYLTPQVVTLSTALTVNPANGPSDNGPSVSLAVQNITPNNFTGTINVNASGVVSITNAGPPGSFTVTIRATIAARRPMPASRSWSTARQSQAARMATSWQEPVERHQLRSTMVLMILMAMR